jgi:hypothetical protein
MRSISGKFAPAVLARKEPAFRQTYANVSIQLTFFHWLSALREGDHP